LGSSYTAFSRDVVALVSKPPLAKQSVLVVDNGGPGRPVCDLLRAAQPPVQLVALGICAGDSVKFTKEHGLTVAKGRLITTLQVLLEQHRLTFAAGLAEAATLQKELANYRVKVTQAAHEVFNAREGEKDDLVLSVALAAWYAAERSAADAGPPVIALTDGCKAITSRDPEVLQPPWKFD
jgi:hypothetical protein